MHACHGSVITSIGREDRVHQVLDHESPMQSASLPLADGVALEESTVSRLPVQTEIYQLTFPCFPCNECFSFP